MVSKTGENGLGYYREQQATVIRLAPDIIPMHGCTPMKITISELINATVKEEQDTAPRTSPPTVKQRLVARCTRADGPEDLSWADDGSLSMISKDHREEGLWAFDTCNPNAWPGAKKYLEKTQADFVAVQEAKVPAGEAEDAEQAARNSGWRTAIGACVITEAEGKSSGVICGRTHNGMKNSIGEEAWPQLLNQ